MTNCLFIEALQLFGRNVKNSRYRMTFGTVWTVQVVTFQLSRQLQVTSDLVYFYFISPTKLLFKHMSLLSDTVLLMLFKGYNPTG